MPNPAPRHRHRHRLRWRLRLMAACIAASPGCACLAQSAPPEGSKVLGALIVSMATNSIASGVASAVGGVVQNLFTNLFNRITQPVNCALIDNRGPESLPAECRGRIPQGAGTAANGLAPPYSSVMQMQSGSLPNPGDAGSSVTASAGGAAPNVGAALAETPALTFVVEQYESDQLNAARIGPFALMTLNNSSDRLVTIRTGESFVTLFQTSVPGQVRVTSVQDGKTNWDVTYLASSEAARRIPTTRAFKLVPPAGREELVYEFLPCLAAGHTAREQGLFAGRLPPCTPAPGGTKGASFRPLAGGKAVLSPDASGQPDQPLMLTYGYVPGQLIVQRIVIDHQP